MPIDPRHIEPSCCGYRSIAAAWIVGLVMWSAAIGVMIVGT